MRFLLLALLFICIQDIYADITNVKQVAGGTCSPNIINQKGDVHFNCYTGAPKEVVEKLDDLTKKYNDISASIDTAALRILDNTTKLRETEEYSRTEITKTKSKVKKLQSEFNIWRESQSELQKQILITVKQLDTDVEIYRRQLSADQNSRFDKVEMQLSNFRETLILLEVRLLRVESDVSRLMDEVFSDGYEKSIFFYGFSVGSLRANDEDNPLFGINAEWVVPKLNIFWRKNALTGEILKVSWKEAIEFNTLPGLPTQSIKNDLDAVLVGGGLKLFLTESHFPLYTGVTLGLSTGDIETPYAGVSLGVEYFTRSARLLLEYRYQYFDSVDQQNISFNNFGDAERTVTSSSVDGHMLTIKLLFR